MSIFTDDQYVLRAAVVQIRRRPRSTCFLSDDAQCTMDTPGLVLEESRFRRLQLPNAHAHILNLTTYVKGNVITPAAEEDLSVSHTSPYSTTAYGTLRQLDDEVDAMSTTETKSTFSSASTLQGIGSLSGRVIMAFGEATLRGLRKIDIRTRLTYTTTTLRKEKDPPPSAYAMLIELQRRTLYPDVVRESAWCLILRELELGRIDGLLQALVCWPSVELHIFLRYLSVCRQSQWTICPGSHTLYRSDVPEHILGVTRRSFCRLLVGLIGHRLTLDASNKKHHSDLHIDWMVTVLLNELHYGLSDVLYELEQFDNVKMELLFRRFMRLDPLQLALKLGYLPDPHPFAEPDLRKRVYAEICCVVRRLMFRRVFIGTMEIPILKLLHFCTLRRFQDWIADLPVENLMRLQSQFSHIKEPGVWDISNSQHAEVPLTASLRRNISLLRSAQAAIPTDPYYVVSAKAEIIVRLRLHAAQSLASVVQSGYSPTLLALLLDLMAIDQKGADVGHLASDLLRLEIKRGFTSSIGDKLLSLDTSDQASCIARITQMAWDGFTPYSSSTLQLQNGVYQLLKQLSKDYIIEVSCGNMTYDSETACSCGRHKRLISPVEEDRLVHASLFDQTSATARNPTGIRVTRTVTFHENTKDN